MNHSETMRTSITGIDFFPFVLRALGSYKERVRKAQNTRCLKRAISTAPNSRINNFWAVLNVLFSLCTFCALIVRVSNIRKQMIENCRSNVCRSSKITLEWHFILLPMISQRATYPRFSFNVAAVLIERSTHRWRDFWEIIRPGAADKENWQRENASSLNTKHSITLLTNIYDSRLNCMLNIWCLLRKRTHMHFLRFCGVLFDFFAICLLSFYLSGFRRRNHHLVTTMRSSQALKIKFNKEPRKSCKTMMYTIKYERMRCGSVVEKMGTVKK